MKPDNISLPDFEILQEKYPDNLNAIIQKINEGYPVQYLIGNVEFLNTKINVNENVLIPRFETELLVSKTIEYAKDIFNKKIGILDLGTGSGCIAIALAKNLDCNVTALDISNKAIMLAQDNAIQNFVDINFKNQDMLDELNGNYDVIISNPPYISLDGYVDENVLKYEPHLALFAKDKGLYFYKEILKRHLKNLNIPGIMAFEIGDNQVDSLKEILKDYPYLKYSFEKDLTDRYRYLFIFNE